MFSIQTLLRLPRQIFYTKITEPIYTSLPKFTILVEGLGTRLFTMVSAIGQMWTLTGELPYWEIPLLVSAPLYYLVILTLVP